MTSVLGRPGESGPDVPPRLVTVVVPTLNRAATLPLALEALATQDYGGEWEVILSFNASPQGAPDLVDRWKERLPRLRAIDSSARAGVSHARNAGAAAAEGDLILFCDDDDEAEPGWLAGMARAAEHADIVAGGLDEEALNDDVSRLWHIAKPKDTAPIAAGWMPYAVGCNFGVRSSLFAALGGFREDYLGAAEDVEFCWRAQLLGYRLVFAPDAVIKYRYRPGLRTLARQVHRYGLLEPRLHREFRPHGAPDPDLRRAARTWFWLMVHVPDLGRGPARRGSWVRRAAYRWGRLRGSVQERVLFL